MAVGPGWEGVRQLVLKRDGFKCVDCGEACDKGAADIHHLIPRSLGGTDDLSNLVTLCDGCHAAYHPTLQVGLARGLIERWGVSLARWLDQSSVPQESALFGTALRLFKVARFREGQIEVVGAALTGRSLLMISPTGSGKSLCFQLPSLLRRGTALVISPLKALMSDQISALQRLKLPGTFINSDLSVSEKEARYELLEYGCLKFLYCAPERFSARDKREMKTLLELKPSFMVVDEAHCVDRWGRDFRPDYGRLGEIRRALGSPPVLAFTASAGRKSQRRILTSLGIPEATVFVRGVDRPNIALLRVPLVQAQRTRMIAKILGVRKSGKAMIFVPTRKRGEEVARALSDLGLNVPFYHSKIENSWERQTLQQRFSGQLRPEIDTIICTNAFGMGLDIPNVSLVVHWQQPASVEDYLQEFGRAGRDGRRALAVIFSEDSDTGVLKFMAEKTVEGANIAIDDRSDILQSKCFAIDEMQRLTKSSACFRKELVTYFEGGLPKTKRSLGQRLINWIFTAKSKVNNAQVCCDFCEGALGRHPIKFAEVALGTQES